MKKRTTTAQRKSTRKPRKLTKAKSSREFIHSLRGKYRGRSLLNALVEEKRLEREF
jgi:hypothetical protein